MNTTMWERVLQAFNKRLGPFEWLLVSKLAEALTPEAAAILREQMAAVNCVQRMPVSKEILLYVIKGGKPNRAGVPSFPMQLEECRVAEAELTVAGKKSKVTYLLVEGDLFSIQLRPWPGRVRDIKGVEVGNVTVLVDPMTPQGPKKPVEPGPELELEAEAMTGWFGEWSRAHGFTGLRAPAPGVDARQELARFTAVFPEEYFEVLAQTEGFDAGTSAVFGASDVYEVHLDDGDYYLIGQVDMGGDHQGYLGVKRGADDGKIYYLPVDGAPPADLGTSLRAALERFLEAEADGAARG